MWKRRKIRNNTSEYALFLDDGRQPKDVKWLELPPLHWVVVKDYDQFVKTVTERGVPTTVSFDHDLADEHYEEYTRAHDPLLIGKREFKYENCKEKTGYHCAVFLAEFCIRYKVAIPTYYIHTLNPIGKQNILSVMENARKVLTESK